MTPANSPCAGRSSTCIPAGEATALRLDFFGDEIETMRRFDPADQRSTGAAGAFTLMPASEALLDEDSIKRFRARYREKFGANATGDPLYQAVSDGRRLAGMEHWLPLFEDKLATLFDHLGEHDVIVRDGGTDGALDSRAEAIEDYFANRERGDGRRAGQLSPARPRRRSILPKKEWAGAIAERADPPRHDLPRARQRPGHRLRASKARATSRPSGRRTPMSTKRSSSTSPSCGRTRRKSFSPATAPARASGSRGCSTIMA